MTKVLSSFSHRSWKISSAKARTLVTWWSKSETSPRRPWSPWNRTSRMHTIVS